MGRSRGKRADNPSRERPNRDPVEWTRTVFDYYKQIATLNGVAAAILLTVYRQEILSRSTFSLAVTLFGLGTLSCAFGMMRLLVFFPLSPGEDQTTDVPFMAQLAGNFFVQAVISTLLSALDLPIWLLLITVVTAFGFFLWALSGRSVFGYGFPKSRKEPGNHEAETSSRWWRRIFRS